MAKKDDTPALGVGLDIGTMNLVAARRTADGVETTRMRDVFLDLELEAKKRLKLSGVNFIEREDGVIIVGDAALEIANVFGKEARRPLSQGLISPGELEALDVLGVLVRNVLGEPKEEDEVCYFSVPASPVDADRDVVYHRGVFSRIIEECGYDPYPGNEAMAIIYNETASEGFSGLAISFGAGMCNIALAINGLEGMSFSAARGGDWIDAGAAKAVGSTRARMCALKEKGLNLLEPEGREQEALALYYRELITYCILKIRDQFELIRGQFELTKAVPLVISGGTAMADGFEEFFGKVFERKRKRFPIEISDVRMVADPLNTPARGLLVQAMQEMEED
jgi:hypothetical protein